MISVITHCKKFTTRNKLFSASVIVQSNLHLEVLTSNVQYRPMSALLLDDALNPATPLTKGAINQTLRQFVPLSDDCLLCAIFLAHPVWLSHIILHERDAILYVYVSLIQSEMAKSRKRSRRLSQFRGGSPT